MEQCSGAAVIKSMLKTKGQDTGHGTGDWGSGTKHEQQRQPRPKAPWRGSRLHLALAPCMEPALLAPTPRRAT